jgi:microcystin-dependent protein
MANYEATKYDFDGANLTGIEGIPTATIVPWSSASVPSGFLECNGTAVSRSTYSALFAIVGTTYGAGDGSTTFNTPDLQDNTPVGKSGTKALGSTGGANTVASTGNVGGSTANATLTTAQLASHSHPSALFDNGAFGGTQNPGRASNKGGNPSGNQETASTGSGSGHSHNMSATFSGTASSVLQPYLTLIYIIKT